MSFRRGVYKWVMNEYAYLPAPGGQGLYNVQEDIGESNDLSEKLPEIMEELKNLFDVIMKDIPEPMEYISNGPGDIY